MSRPAFLLLTFAVGVLLGALCVVIGFNLGAATATEPGSRPVPEPSFVPFRPPEDGTPPDEGAGTDRAGEPSRPPRTVDIRDAAAGETVPGRAASPGSPVPASPDPTQPPRDNGGVGSAARGSITSGLATWYSVGPGLYAAAGPLLRTPGWRGRMVEACVKGHAQCLRVQLVDWCACGDRPGGPTVIDLSVDAFARLAPPSRGLVEVTVTW